LGNPCNIEVIDAIARKYNLKVIYDAAHCFGVTYQGKSIFDYGDVSTCSFHATKLFHTGEGGAISATTLPCAAR
jgi:dTDP-4-amino-4,6-dideoxygalactose transaminase